MVAAAVALIASGLWLLLSLPFTLPARLPQAERARASARQLSDLAETLVPQAIEPLDKRDALVANAAIPFSMTSIAPGMRIYALDAGVPFTRALNCMTAAIYYEAGSEPVAGQRAVAQVILNRVRHPAFPASVCGVIFQGSERRTGCQFSFTCDGSLQRKPSTTSWLAAREVARQALAGFVFADVGLSTHYHANYVVPYWAHTLRKNVAIGRHIFYQWPGNWGVRGAFVQPYSQEEPNITMDHTLVAVPVGPTAFVPSARDDRAIFDLSGQLMAAGVLDGTAPPQSGTMNDANEARYVIAMEGPVHIAALLVSP